MKIFLHFCLILLSFVIIRHSYAKTSLRMASTSPALTEIIYSLKMEDDLYGVSPYCLYPEGVKYKEKVGSTFNLDLEMLMRLKINIVLLSKLKSSKTKDQLDKLKISYREYSQDTLEDILFSIKDLGELTEHNDQAQTLISQIQTKLSELKSKSSKIKKTAIVIIGHDLLNNGFRNIYVMGKSTYYQSILDSLGLENVLKVEGKGAVISNEEILRLNPDYIFDLLAQKDKKYEANVNLVWGHYYKKLKAVKNNKVFIINNNYAHIPGPRIINLIDDFSRFVEEKN